MIGKILILVQVDSEATRETLLCTVFECVIYSNLTVQPAAKFTNFTVLNSYEFISFVSKVAHAMYVKYIIVFKNYFEN